MKKKEQKNEEENFRGIFVEGSLSFQKTDWAKDMPTFSQPMGFAVLKVIKWMKAMFRYIIEHYTHACTHTPLNIEGWGFKNSPALSWEADPNLC